MHTTWCNYLVYHHKPCNCQSPSVNCPYCGVVMEELIPLGDDVHEVVPCGHYLFTMDLSEVESLPNRDAVNPDRVEFTT